MLDVSRYHRFAGNKKLMERIAFLEIEWRRMCPDVDLQNQVGWAHYWLQTKGKGYTNMIRFLSNWFKKCQERAEENRQEERRTTDRRKSNLYKEHKPPEDEIMTAEDFRKMRAAL